MRVFIIMLLATILTGCGNSRFDCPYAQGPSCLSMEQIDKNIKSGKQNNCQAIQKVTDKKDVQLAVIESATPQPAKRIPEEVLQMWIAPYETTDGIFYQASFVNVIVKDARWIGPKVLDASN